MLFGSETKSHRVISPLLGMAAFTLIFAPLASADVLVAVDEWGKGFACTYTTGLAGYPACAYDPAAGVATFLRLGSGLATDPITGFTNVLTYYLPGLPDLTPLGSLSSPDAQDGGNDGDFIDFVGSNIFFYSRQDPAGTGSCATQLPNIATGCDGVADVPTLPSGASHLVNEVGSDARGDASILYEVTGFTFIFVSDELTSCMGIPGCGPENIAPPPNNPYRDLIGLDAGGQIQPLLVGDNVDPLDVTPEPSTFGVMLGAVMIIWLAHRHRRRAAR